MVLTGKILGASSIGLINTAPPIPHKEPMIQAANGIKKKSKLVCISIY